ncbi:MAG: tRNA pseudouridine(55) synthase TruB [Bacilli bacterium]|nr:tRNA pseudouridine(55) synthase TruB [Bacilli bacterium]
MNGILIINKEKDYTSRDVVNIISKELKTKKVGHTGTLDPLAEGVLVICIGSATKLVEIITNNDKEYIAEITLGLKTDTLDITGNLLKEEVAIVDRKQIQNVIKLFEKTYEQTVPIYSAVKINGKKLYQYARNDEYIELPKRKITIKKIELLGDIKYEDNKTIFTIKCLVSKGTYIRSLIDDIAKELNTIGVMSKLTRTAQGIFDIKESYSIDDVKNNNYKLIKPKEILNEYFIVICDENLEFKIKNGSLIDNIYNHDIVLFKNKQNNILSIYKVYEKDKTKLKPWKMFADIDN